ncbi:MAG: ribosome biogenesis GTPase Der [Proteobacteria bacterium]|nr:ribosome biogenesis GTPase Der [Pseudomonadota bacterium]
MRYPIITIVGRPNVGKSTLFNRVLGEKRAIVEDQPGVTRDRNYALVERFQVPFLLVDTGGIDTDAEDEIGKQVIQQTLFATEEADVIIALFDGATGCVESDRDVVQILRKFNKQIYYVVNKCDGDEQGMRTADFYQLGISDIQDVSALHGRRVKVMFEEILAKLPNYPALLESAKSVRLKFEEAKKEAQKIGAEEDDEEEIVEESIVYDEEEETYFSDIQEAGDEVKLSPSFAPVFLPEDGSSEQEYDKANKILPLEFSEEKEVDNEEEGRGRRYEPEIEDENAVEEEVILENIENIKIAIIGRPNVGKSTLLNTLSGAKRAITSPIAGTTRDNLDIVLKRDGQEFTLVDTAGLRKKAKIEESSVERYSALRAIGALAECDVAIVVIDATQGMTDQDGKIVGLAHERGAGIVIAVNKWDLIEKNHKTVHEFTEKVKDEMKFAKYAEIIYISALSGRRCPNLIEAAKKVAYERTKRISTGALNKLLRRVISKSPPAQYRGRDIKLYYASQVDISPPRFVLFFNYPKELHFSFIRQLKNTLRDKYGFEGTDIKLACRKR